MPGDDRRLRATIRGAVQGVGFRPFVYRLATDLQLRGFVTNTSHGVVVEVEGSRERIDVFLPRIDAEKPPRAAIHSLESSILDPVGYEGFEIRESDAGGARTAVIMPDIATCADCARDTFDPVNRRYRYPFTNCTNCGPRYSIMSALPYDRPHTAMRGFVMCEQCRAEYDDPADRRFHAQPNACARCGPHLELWDEDGRLIASDDEALHRASAAIATGRIVALKGLGGFHLIADARSDEVVRRLRARKHREEKPFATMFPSLDVIRHVCHVEPLEERLLRSPEAPIVLVRRREPAAGIAESVAPNNPYLGVMLPYTPLHLLLLHELSFPIVATSGNRSDEPICTDAHEALERLGGIADLFLVHDRPIVRHVDDSIVRVMAGREMVLRRARGFAPLPLPLRSAAPAVLAVGAHLKNVIAIAVGEQAFPSQHIGDLETAQASDAFERAIGSLRALYEFQPTAVACDSHPDYVSTRYARRTGLRVIPVQHHYAHVLACMVDNDLEPPVLGVAWDGTGYGEDGTVWGGEFLRVDDDSFRRIAHLRRFRLPGGEAAIREPRRAAVGVLFELFGGDAFEMKHLLPVGAFRSRELSLLRRMLERGVNAPLTSSAGRLFDAVASLCGMRQVGVFEGQPAMELEFALDGSATDDRYECRIDGGGGGSAAEPLIVDWEPVLRGVLQDIVLAVPAGIVSARFHNSLVEAIVEVARRTGEPRVCLTGGCFQNRYLCERSVARLQQEGFRAYWHQRLPPHDGGIAVGQIVAAARSLSGR